MIIISASGMATGGRVIHHLKAFVTDERTLVLLTGFQAPGTRGGSLAAGAPTLRIHDEEFPIRAEVRQLQASSSHAHADEILTWLKQLTTPLRQTFITHGEPGASDALRQRIERQLGWSTLVPEYRHTVELAALDQERPSAVAALKRGRHRNWRRSPQLFTVPSLFILSRSLIGPRMRDM